MPVEVQSLAEWEASGIPGMLSVLIPAHNEQGQIADTVLSLVRQLTTEGIRHEILVVNDNSSDGTEAILRELSTELSSVRYINNNPPNGFGFAVRKGLAEFRGEAVAIVMADGSDDATDVAAFFRKQQTGYDCVFGTRFALGGSCLDYPLPKLMLNRMANTIIRVLFGMRYNDITNAFKLYHRRVIAGVQPLLAYHFNLTVEIPLKAMIRGYRFAILPNSWRNRKEGVSKFKIKEMGSRYLFIVLYCLLEKMLAKGDYHSLKDNHDQQLQVWQR